MNKRQGSIFWSENDIFHPLPKTIFSRSRDTPFFLLLSCPFCLNWTLFWLVLPFYFPSSHYLIPFFLFLLHVPLFSLPLFILFPQDDICWYPPLGGKGCFPTCRPLINGSATVVVGKKSTKISSNSSFNWLNERYSLSSSNENYIRRDKFNRGATTAVPSRWIGR